MSRLCAALFAFGFPLLGVAQRPVQVLTQHNDNARTGANLHESLLTPANVDKQHFGMVFKRAVDDQVYTQPLLATDVPIAGGTHDIVVVTTVNNSVYAFDANDPAESTPLWHVNFGTPANLHSFAFGCLDINGQMGIIGTPVIDAERRALYVVALTKAGSGFQQRLHALDLSTGADLPESPVMIAAAAFDPLMQNQRPALLLANNNVYIAYSSHCDKDPYHGFIMAYDQATLHQQAIFNTSPTGMEASIWQSGQGPAADGDGNVYVVTGNGDWNGRDNLSESFLKFSPSLKLLDWFTPTNHLQLDKDDNDLDSSGATLIPGTHLVLGGGKEGVLYTLDTRKFGHLGDTQAVEHFKATGSHLHSLVYWQSEDKGKLLYIWGQRDKARVYQFQPDGIHLGEEPLMMRDLPNEGHPGAMLSLSASGGKEGILWAAIHATGDSWHESRPGILHAYEAANIQHELWNSLEVPARDDCGRYSKMAPPTIANGKVYLPSFGANNIGTGQLCAYGLLPGSPATAPAAPSELKGEIRGDTVFVSWSAAASTQGLRTTYRVERTSTNEPEIKTVAFGLTTPAFTEPAPAKGTSRYTVYTLTSQGLSAASQPVAVALPPPPKDRMQH